MSAKKQYTGDTAFYVKKLERVMERLGVSKYNYDWIQHKDNASCFVEIQYGGRTYRFENSARKSEENGRGLKYVSDLLATIILSLEGLARAVEQGIFSLDMLLEGVPALPESRAPLDPCFTALGFSEMPESADEVNAQFKRMAKVMHPDTGGNEQAFRALINNRDACLAYFN